jgi:hypothetical protein
MKRNLSSRWAGLASAVVLQVLVAAPLCRACLLQFTLDPANPIILSFNGSLSYNSTTHNFHSETVPLTFSAPFVPGGFTSFKGDPKATVDLFVDQSGGFMATGGGFRLTGDLDLDGDGMIDVSSTDADPLVFGRIVNFGAEPPGPPTRTFNGLFEIEGGKLTQTITLTGGGTVFGGFPTNGVLGGFFLFAENVTVGTLGDFRQNFASTNVKDNVGVTPEPGSGALGLVALVLLASAGWFKGRARQAES